MITEKDFDSIKADGRSLELIKRQYEYLVGKKIKISGIRPAIIGDGILEMDTKEKNNALQYFNTNSEKKRWIKFVPASGVASRMFSSLQNYIQVSEQPNFDLSKYFESEEGTVIQKLKKQFKKLPFFETIFSSLSGEIDQEIMNPNLFLKKFINKILYKYETFPKALIPFFIDKNAQEWTPFEAQLLEVTNLSNQKNLIPLHLTIDKNHRELFDKFLDSFKKKLNSTHQVSFDVQYSHQNRLTDTPFIDQKNFLVRNEHGNIEFRKGGHGSLLENINLLDADCIWIKNIDNILLGKSNKIGEEWMKILAGKLLMIQNDLFEHLNNLEQLNKGLDLSPIIKFIRKNFDPEYNYKVESKPLYQVLYDYLHRPIRICGMIPNEGATGGGPFWKNDIRGQSLQIIEGVEFDQSIEEHKNVIRSSTHFNPVIMVCGITDHKGDKYSLLDFRDEKRAMISKKIFKNKPIKILEWPGLWNGGMAEWNTIFIQLPSETFNPVKSVIDLIR
tara:strand:+ start:49173 stop:50678 length:1506 start_codon:yes stop_codon:yes gene_type:complete